MGDHQIENLQASISSQSLCADAAVRSVPRNDRTSCLKKQGNDSLLGDSFSSTLPSLFETVSTSEFVNLDSKYLCIACNKVLRDAMQTPCGHRICLHCVENLLPNGYSVPCPAKEEDCVPITMGNVCKDSGARREVRALLVYCKNKDSGCKVTIQLGQLGSHLNSCEFTPIECDNSGCNVRLTRNNLPLHQKECMHGLTPCQKCSQQIPKKDLEVHVQDECTATSVMCPNGCGADQPRRELQSHLESCPMSVSTCKFSGMGCHYKGSNEELMSHYSENMTSHLEFTTVYIAQLELRSLKNKRIIKDLTTENQNLKHELDGIRKEHRQEVEGLKKALRDLKVKTVNLTERCINLERSVTNKAEKREVERLTRDMAVVQGVQSQLLNSRQEQSSALGSTTATQLTAIDKSVGLHDVRLAEMDLRFQILETVSYNGEMMWKVTDYSRRKHEAKTGRTLSLYSQPFYSSRYGYKMCARLYLNGDGIGRGTHLSLYFVIMKGDFDDLLEWPFTKKITMMLLDQYSRANHVVETFYTDKNSSSFKKPTNEMNIASGCPLFILQSRLESQEVPYLKNDTLYFKVTINDV